MTGFLGISIVVALAIPLVTRGSYSTLCFDTHWEWGLLLAGGIGLSFASDHLPSLLGFDVGFGALVASYALLLAFCGRNITRAGIAVVMIGLAANALAVTINHGMPVRVPTKWVAEGGLAPTVRHHATDGSTRLYWMTDVIYLPHVDEVISFGDLILAIGLADVAFECSRRRRHAAQQARAEQAGDLGTAARYAVTPTPPDDLVRVLPRDDGRSVAVARECHGARRARARRRPNGSAGRRVRARRSARAAAASRPPSRTWWYSPIVWTTVADSAVRPSSVAW